MKKLIFITLFISFLPVTTVAAPRPVENQLNIPLHGEWLIRTDDKAVYSGARYEDSSWGRITLPGSFIRYMMKSTGEIGGIIWLRKKVILPEKIPPEGIGLILGKIGNADVTYVNGHLVGKTGKFPPDEFSMWNFKRFYHIPAGLLVPGKENYIAVRIACGVYGEVRGELTMTGMAEWNRNRHGYILTNIVLYYGILGIGVAIGLIFLIIFLMGRGESDSAFFILQLVPGFFVVYEICGIFPIFPDNLARIKVFGFMWTALVVVHLMFLHRLYGLKRRGIEIALGSMLVIFTAMILAAADINRHRFVAEIIIAVLTPLALYNISIHLQALWKKNIYARYLVVPGFILSLGAGHDGFAYLQRVGGPQIKLMGYGFEHVIFGYAATVMFIGGAMILVHRFMQSMKQVEELNENLESRVRERTRELEQSLNHLSLIIEDSYLEERTRPGKSKTSPLSESTVEKIQRAVLYIHDNFMHDISREGLAAHLDINADHLGKAFRSYTGRKMNEYINELRIKRAALMLKESDEPVIQIAFAVGFESLRTFNRSFLKVMGVTPTVYRNYGYSAGDVL